MYKSLAIAIFLVSAIAPTPNALAEGNASCTAVDKFLSEGAHSEAIRSINQCLSRDLSDDDYGCLLLKRGQAYFEMGQGDKSGGDVGSAMRKDPDLKSPDNAAACLGVSTNDAASILETASDD